jgi:hypothetical protein
MSLAILPCTDSRASLLGLSDSASQQTGSYQSILDPVTERLMEALMELVEPPPMCPSYVLKSVLWDFEDCLDLAECYGRLAVVSDVDDGGVCPECRQRVERSAVLYRSKYNRAMLGSRWT